MICHDHIAPASSSMESPSKQVIHKVVLQHIHEEYYYISHKVDMLCMLCSNNKKKT